ncbi:MAG TPA: LPS export ABC transporter permease LptG [Gammaproteobacteria bacterium]|nr:LPS export ABC transporter permease LptG [Gammaproteobacteria bacterium]
MVLDRYIAKSVINGCLLAGFVMISIFAFVDYVSQLSDVGKGDYGPLQAALYVLFRLPQRLYEIAPSVILLGGILSLGSLAASSELTVMRASGVTTLRITRSVLQTGLLIAILVGLLGEYVVPSAIRTAKTYRAQAIEKKLIVGGSSDIWARDGNRYVNVKRILPDHQLRQVRIYELDKSRQLSSLTYAERARYQDGEWVLDNIKRSTISTTGIETSYKKKTILKRLLLLELFTVLELEPSDMSATELLTYSQYLQENNLDNDEYLLSFWVKIFTPLTCLVMLMVAMPIVFATTPRSGGAGQRIMLAVVIGILYFMINQGMTYLGLAIKIAPALSASASLILVAIISLYFLKRVN